MYWKEPIGPLSSPGLREPVVRAARRPTSSCACIERRLGIGPGERTADGRFSFEEVECLACCGTAPVMQVSNATYHENLDVPRARGAARSLAGD